MLLSSPAFGQTSVTPVAHTPQAVVQATRIAHPPVIDGHLTDEG